MKKSELRQIIQEMIREELGTETALQEDYDKSGYVIKAWSNADFKTSGTPVFDSSKDGTMYTDFEEVLEVLRSSKLSDLGAYEITWVSSNDK